MCSDVNTLLIPFDSGYDASRVGGPTVLLILDWRYVNDCFCILAFKLLTMSLGFKDRIYMRYETMPDRAFLPLTFLVSRLFINVQFALVVLQSSLYVLVVFQTQTFVAERCPPGCGISCTQSCKFLIHIRRWHVHSSARYSVEFNSMPPPNGSGPAFLFSFMFSC